MLSWHQLNARRRIYALRNEPAHIHGDDYLWTGLCLCGVKDPPVYVEWEHAHNPANRTCAKCLAELKRVSAAHDGRQGVTP